jgi:hypothetical protein
LTEACHCTHPGEQKKQELHDGHEVSRMTAFHFLKQAILLIACCSTLVQMVLASPAAEAAVDRSAACPAIEENTHAATWWQVESTDDGHVATLKNPMGAGSITVDLDMDGPSTPVLLGWEVLAQYDGSVGLLHYYSGATGGHVSADITRYIVINLLTGATRLSAPVAASMPSDLLISSSDELAGNSRLRMG